MNKNIIGFTLLVFLINSTLLFAKEDKSQLNQTNYTKVITLDKGVKRTLLIPKDDSAKSSITPYSAKQATVKQGIIIRFKDPKLVSMDLFTEKYGLKLQKKLVIGYYIFENLSTQSDVELISDIMKNEQGIETIKPNWPKKKQPY